MDIEGVQRVPTESEFDASIQRKIEQKNNSGYLPAYYETTEDFPQVPDYYFRIEDDKTIIELQKLKRESQPLQFDFSKGSEKYQQGMNRLMCGLDSFVLRLQEEPGETHGYYGIDEEDDYDHDRAFGQYQLQAGQAKMTEQFQKLTIKPKPKFTSSKIITEEKPIRQLTSKMQKLQINEY